MSGGEEQRAREVLAEGLPGPAWKELRSKIRDGSVLLHSDPISWVAGSALHAILSYANERAAQAREEERAAINAEMPTIWEDPAGKGYPCFERPMKPAEAREMIERDGRRIAELEEQLAQAREEERAACAEVAIDAANGLGGAGVKASTARAELRKVAFSILSRKDEA